MKTNPFALMFYLLFALLFGSGIQAESPQELFDKRLGLVLRGVGHDLLRRSGDSTSKVLPVRRIAAQTYQIQFESTLAFVPDDLVAVVQQRMKTSRLSDAYMVNVLGCGNTGVVFGFEIKPNPTEAIACQGRKYPVGCYRIQVTILDAPSSRMPLPSLWWGVAGVLLLGGGWVAARRLGRSRSLGASPQAVLAEPTQRIGNMSFWPEKQLLYYGEQRIELSERESRLLSLLSEQLGQLIERDYLLRVLWENEGVFVGGRSLDVLVSKLRKKLQADARLRITNIHGKGYKLEEVAPA